jgi:small subunit ribosomal protein S9
MPQQSTYHQAVGRRKEAVARVRLFPGKGQLIVNGLPIAEYFRGPIAQKKYQRPFEVTKTLGDLTGTIKVLGGGPSSQLDAVIHGIARALNTANKEAYHSLLRGAGLLTREIKFLEGNDEPIYIMAALVEMRVHGRCSFPELREALEKLGGRQGEHLAHWTRAVNFIEAHPKEFGIQITSPQTD